MKLSFERGRKADDDRIILVETEGPEAITIFRVGLLVNQLAVNESTIHDLDWNEYPFYFAEFVAEAAEHGKEGIDWADPEFEDKMRELLDEVEVGEERIDHKLLRRAQRRLSEWSEADPNPEPYPGDVPVVDLAEYRTDGGLTQDADRRNAGGRSE